MMKIRAFFILLSVVMLTALAGTSRPTDAEESDATAPGQAAVDNPLPAPETADTFHPGLELKGTDLITMPEGLTAFAAMEHVTTQISKTPTYLDLMDTEAIQAFQSAPATFYTAIPTEWTVVLREILKPHELDYLEEESLVRVGPKAAIAHLRDQYQQEKLERNHERIPFNFSAGIPLFTALKVIQEKADIPVSYERMDAADRRTEDPGLEVTASEGTPPPPPPPKTYLFTLEGQDLPWRTALREILDPHDYAFVESAGMVQIMKKTDADAAQKALIDRQPLVVRYVRVYHASPKLLAEQLNDIQGLKKHSQARITATKTDSSKDAHSIRYKGTGLSASSSGEGDTVGGEIGDANSYQDMERYRTPPGLLLVDIESNLDRIEEVVRRLDVRERQIVIETKIFTVGANSMRNLGVNWGEQGLHGNASFRSGLGREETYSRSRATRRAKGSTNIYTGLASSYQFGYRETGDLRNPSSENVEEEAELSRSQQGQGSSFSSDWTDSTLDQTLNTFERIREMSTAAGYSAILNPLEFDFMWEAVQNINDFKMVSQPMIVIGDHSEALIRVGNIEPAFTKEWGEADENGYRPYSYKWQMVQTGVSLWVVPEISADGRMVRLSIHPQTSDALERVIAGENEGSYPVLSIREVDTRVTVPSGATLMLGGLIDSSGGKIQRKIPFLGSIPFIGRLFRWDSDSREGNNLIILLTPTILDDDNPDSGYENPSQPYLEDLMRGVGRNLGEPLPDFEGKVTKKSDPLPKDEEAPPAPEGAAFPHDPVMNSDEIMGKDGKIKPSQPERTK